MTTEQLDVYQAPAQPGQYQARLAMTPEQAKALDEQVRQCTQAVLREGTDYGIIPGTSGEKTLWRPGAQKLLQWFGLSVSCERVDIERDDDGRKHGITYRATVARRLPDGTLDIKATCEGTADYDESKFHQTAEEVQAKAEAKERKFAKIDGRVANPTKWKGDPSRGIPAPGEYRADWNALMKRAQKRAIVGAVVDATAAGGIFTDREEDDHAPVAQDDGPTWYEQAIELALASTQTEPGGELQALFTGATQAHKDGLISRRQQDHVQNTVRQRLALLKKAAVVDVEDLGRQAQESAADPTTSGAPSSAAAPDSGSPKETAAPSPSSPDGSASTPGRAGSDAGQLLEDEPGTASKAQLTKLHAVLTGLGFAGDDREQKLKVTEAIIGRPLGTGDERSSKDLSWTEARKVIDALDGLDRDGLIAYMAEHEVTT